MQAVLCRQFGPPSSLSVEDVPVPQPGPGQVLIRVAAAAVNFPDTLIIAGKYQQKPPFPFSPGGEVAGTVAALGEDAAGPAVGTPVLAMINHGGFAEYALAPADAAVPVPPGVDPAAATVLPFAYGTTLHALRDRAALQPGETLLVLGASGGVGQAAIQLGKLLGARVVAAASPAKLDACRAAGADATVDYTQENWRDALKQVAPAGVDVVYDAVGGPFAEPALRSLNWRGRFLVVGFAAGEIPRIPLNLALLKGCAILGVFYGEFVRREPGNSRALLAELLEWVRDGKLHPPVSATYPLEQAPAALDALLARRATGKLVLLTRPEDS